MKNGRVAKFVKSEHSAKSVVQTAWKNDKDHGM